MAENTKIEWADHTFNPWEGCTKVSPGCANCYAEVRNKRWNKGEAINWGKGAPRRRTSVANWRKVLKWNREAGKNQLLGRSIKGNGANVSEDEIARLLSRPRVFCASLADWLDDEVPLEWLVDLLNLIDTTDALTWLLLTKRPANLRQRLRYAKAAKNMGSKATMMIDRWMHGFPPKNVWLGTSVEDQLRWDERVPELLRIAAVKHFVSAEPLLGGIRMGEDRPEWLIVGGESGPGARVMEEKWAYDLRDQCDDRTAFFFKQWGGVDKKSAGRLLDGRTWDEVPF